MAKVLIIGAGPGGLILAHILHANQIPFEIFERDEAVSSRKQGWAIALVECLASMEEMLPSALVKEINNTSVNHNTGDNDELSFVDSATGKRVKSIGGVPRGQEGHFLRASRQGLRRTLMQAQNLPVSMGKHFMRYEQDDAGVTAFFEDGTTARGSILVGADGVHSHVLDQLIGNSQHQPTLSRNVPIFGEVNLPKDMYEPLRALGNSVILAGAPGVRKQIGMLHMDEDKSHAFYFWTVVLWREEPNTLTKWLHNATKQETYDFVLKTIDGLHPVVTDLIRHGGPEAIVHPAPSFFEFVPPDALPTGRVTVLGDAGHAMVPFRGAGANTAIRDACDLGKLLIEAWRERKDFAQVLAPYHDVMLPRGKENVLSSRAAGEGRNDAPDQWSIMFESGRNPAGSGNQ